MMHKGGKSAKDAGTTSWRIRRWWRLSFRQVAVTTTGNKDTSNRESKPETQDARRDANKGENGNQRRSDPTGYRQCQSSSNSKHPAQTTCSTTIAAPEDRVINLKIAEDSSYSRKQRGSSSRKHNVPGTLQYQGHPRSEHHHHHPCSYPRLRCKTQGHTRQQGSISSNEWSWQGKNSTRNPKERYA